MGLNRYYVPNLPKAGSVLLPAEESHHALRVRREMEGGFCVAFDGKGNRANCKIVRTTKRDVTIEIESFCFEPNELPGKILLAVAMPKGDRQKGVIEKAVELGVHELIPLICHRSVAIPSESSAEKWARIVIEACKQCERNRNMVIASPCSFESLIQFHSSNSQLHMIAHPQSESEPSNTTACLYNPIEASYSEALIAIGPEGGFTEKEVQFADDSKWLRLDLGSRILRVETAVCAALFYAGLRVKNNA